MTKKVTKKVTKKESVATRLPDYSVNLSKGTLGVSVTKMDDVYSVEIKGISTVKTLQDLEKLQELVNDVVSLVSFDNEDNTISEDECCVGPCYCGQ